MKPTEIEMAREKLPKGPKGSGREGRSSTRPPCQPSGATCSTHTLARRPEDMDIHVSHYHLWQLMDSIFPVNYEPPAEEQNVLK